MNLLCFDGICMSLLSLLRAILSYISVVSVYLHLYVRMIYLFKVHRVYVSNELFEISIG